MLWIGAGSIFTGLGVLGLFLPLLPTTPFLLLASACFLRGSERLHRWLLRHRLLGPYIRNYREHRAVSRRGKIATLTLLWGTILSSITFVARSSLLRLFLLAIALAVTVHVVRMKTMK